MGNKISSSVRVTQLTNSILACMGSGGTAPIVLILDTMSWSCRSTVRPGPLYSPGRRPRNLLNKGPGRPQTGHGHFGEDTNLLTVSRIEHWIVQPVANSLYSLRWRLVSNNNIFLLINGKRQKFNECSQLPQDKLSWEIKDGTERK